MTVGRLASTAAWVAAAIPGLGQLGLVFYTMLARFRYPYDLEWMEGGLLSHAERIDQGSGIYLQPSVEFIPYLYTPLYPAFVAMVGQLFGISYAVGRGISIAAAIAVVVLSAVAITRHQDEPTRLAARCGAVLAGGLWASCYPFMDGWYDLVRADTLFLALVIGGLLGVRAFATSPGRIGMVKLAATASLLALSFFCKQTGVLFVAAGGAIVLVSNWRRVPLYVVVTGAIGLGGTALLNRATQGWFWTYIYEVHQAHDFNSDRVWASFGNILWHYPALTLVVAISCVTVLATAIRQRARPPGCEALVLWTPLFAASTVIGAISWGTQWAHFNAYMPAFATGAIAAGGAVPAVVGVVRAWTDQHSKMPLIAGLATAAALAAQLIAVVWTPSTFIPTPGDRAAGGKLIDTLRDIPGDVYVPYHPWYQHLAGKPLYTHRMGLLDMSYRNRWQIAGLREAFATQLFSAVVVDNRPLGPELSALRTAYKCQTTLTPDRQPFVYSGAGARHKTGERKLFPHTIWVPARPEPIPPGATVVFDFESPALTGWETTGTAWGRAPATRGVGKQGLVCGFGGRRFVTSFRRADAATGSIESPEFLLSGPRVTLRVGGGNHPATLRAELVVDGQSVATATGSNREQLTTVTWDVAEHRGKPATLRLVDEETGSWGHLNVDDLWVWSE